jgi:4-amino-4-deoxy-L-arabinose transferase-like glycosyltransferase
MSRLPPGDLGEATNSNGRTPWLPLEFDGRPHPLKTWLFLLVCAAWLIPGLFGHDPWKYEEAVSLGVIQEMVWHGHWLSPHLAGEPYLQRPPFYYWLAAALVRLVGTALPPHESARLASALCMVVTLYSISRAAQALYGPRHSRLAVMLLVGTIGLVIRAHEINPDLGFLAGYSLALWGIAQARATEGNRELAAFGISPEVRGGVELAGLLTGVGIMLAYLSRGGLALGMTLPLLAWAAWRRRSQGSTLWPLLVLALGLPALGVGLWIWAASGLPNGGGSADPAWFAAWWSHEGSRILSPLRWIDQHADPGFYPALLTWYGWPIAPLALWTAWDAWRGRLGEADVRLPALAATIGLVCLGLGTAPREASSLPLLLPLALLATAGVDHLRRGAASFLDWFGSMTFGLFCALLWLGWVAQLTGQPARIVAYLDRQLPNYDAQFHWGPFLFSAAVSLLWLTAIAKSRQNARRAVLNWAVGMTTFWLLIMTLWLPFIDASRSYRAPFTTLAAALPGGHGCVASRGLGEPQRALLEYFTGMHTERLETGRGGDCPYLLEQTRHADTLPAAPEQLLWEGTRPGDRDEWFRLLRLR